MLQNQPGEIACGEAYLRYRSVGEDKSVMQITDTAVPPAYRGQGIAEKLCDAAFDYARSEGLAVLPSCKYVRDHFLPRNKECHDLALASFDADTPGLQITVSLSGIATIQLTEARRRNPLTVPILERLQSFLRECAAVQVSQEGPPPHIRSILIEALGPVFCSGHNFTDFQGVSTDEQRRILDVCTEVNILLQEVPQVSVAAVQGKCFAAGAQLAASCDLVLAKGGEATFCLPGVRMGGFCHNPSVAVAARVSVRKALELAVLAPEIDAEEAQRAGLVNQVIPPGEWRSRVRQVAAQLAASFNKNLADGKRTLYAQAAAPTLEQKYALASGPMIEGFSSPVYEKAMQEFLARRKAPKSE